MMTRQSSASDAFDAASGGAVERQAPEELTEHKLAQRQRQVDIGKASAGYARYVDAVPRDKREFRNAQHPATPDRTRACSKRAWDGQVKVWRFALKQWEPAEDGAAAPRRITPEQIAETAPAASS